MRIPAWQAVASGLALSFAVFHLYTAGFGLLPDMVQRAVHVSFGILIAFTVAITARPSAGRILVLAALALASVTSTVWLGINYERLILSPYTAGSVDVAMAVAIVVPLIVAAFLILGLPFVILATVGLAYALWGEHLPNAVAAPPGDLAYLAQYLYATTRGLWGITTAATATSVAVFVLFGGLFLRTDGARSFLDLAFRLVGRSVGGPAKLATVFSALFGSVSGSAAANASVTGNYTIPLMKRSGYSPEQAAGVESAASAGGQILPPVMGAAGFVMAEFLGVHYLTVALAATIPALLYFTGMFVASDLNGRIHGRYMPDDEIEDATRRRFDFAAFAQFVVPVCVLMLSLSNGWSEVRAGAFTILTLAVTYLLIGRDTLKTRLRNIVIGLTDGGRALVLIAVLAATAQILVGVMGITGVGLTLTGLVVEWSGDNLFMGLGLVAAVVTVLGMGMPTTAAYVLGVAITGRVLLDMGLAPLSAHMFILYFASAAALTPPVCVGVFVAAGIAGSDWLKSALYAMWFGLGKYVTPFAFVFYGALLMQDVDTAGMLRIAAAFAGIGLLSAAIALSGAWWRHYRSIPLSVALAVCGIAMFLPDLRWVVGAMAAAVPVILLTRQFLKGQPRAARASREQADDANVGHEAMPAAPQPGSGGAS